MAHDRLPADASDCSDKRSLAMSSLKSDAPACVMDDRVREALVLAKEDTIAELRSLCKEEFLSSCVAFEERCTRLHELTSKYAGELAMHRKVLRAIVAAVGLLIALALMLLYRYLLPPTPRPSRWSGPMHFTIPILSPFSSIVSSPSSSAVPLLD
ncbi:hypothetical protein BV20DRAFT_79929 [Pilatotrama ljubarskyi]|nr:hypothetical protein BV20DRAFT_79929 [Pilatotrama ljubarskyi]